MGFKYGSSLFFQANGLFAFTNDIFQCSDVFMQPFYLRITLLDIAFL